MTWVNKFHSIVPQYEIFHDATVVPLTHLTISDKTFDGGVYDNDGNLIARARHKKNGYTNTMPDTLSIAPPTHRMEGKYLYGGMLQNGHFGHFLVESLSRLWVSKQVNDADGVVFILRTPNKMPAGFVDKLLTLLVGDIPVHFLKEPTAVETLVVPDQLAHPRSGYLQGHAAHRPLFDGLKRYDASAPKKVYLSRSELKSNEGCFLGEKVLEENLRREGYEIVHPQQVSMEEQLRIYTNAEKLIFADGSAFHLYILVANESQDTFIIWRRKNHDDFTHQLQTFVGRRPAGVPCLKGFYTETDRRHSTATHKALLDFNELKLQLQKAGFLATQSWQGLSEDEIAQETEFLSKRLKRNYQFIETNPLGAPNDEIPITPSQP